MQKHIWIYIVLLAILLSNYACMERKDKKDNNSVHKIEIRRDVEPIMRRFPKLENAEKVYWIGELLGNSRSRVPGPSSYYMKGYIFLQEEQSTVFKNQFSWKEAGTYWKPDFTIPEIDMQNFRWLHSSEFDMYIMSASFVGKFYFEEKHQLLYFDIQS